MNPSTMPCSAFVERESRAPRDETRCPSYRVVPVEELTMPRLFPCVVQHDYGCSPNPSGGDRNLCWTAVTIQKLMGGSFSSWSADLRRTSEPPDTH